MYNSDYEIRLATLAALGGDTSITYDSVYSIDLEILRLTEQGGGGGGEGLNWNQIENLLATSGVSEIIVNSSDSSITLDYDLLSQIGQGGGGGDYVCVDSVDALSGITSPKDGAIAYVAGKGMWKYYADTAITKWLAYDVDYDTLTAEEINTMCADYYIYRKELRMRTIHSDEYDNRHLWFLTPGQIYGDGWMSFVSTISRSPGDRQQILKLIFRKLNNVWQLSTDETAILELYTKGKSENDIWNDTKNKLTNRGVDSIKFNSGSTSSITLDYDLVSQIGQGGMDYNDVKTDLATSGLTKILVLGDSGRTIDLDYNLLEDIEPFDYAKVQSGLTNEGVKEILVKDSADTTSITLDYDLVSQIGQGGIGGGDYVCIDSVDALSGITNPKDGAIAYVAGKGMWKYYADTAITKWLAYDVEFEALTQTEKNTLCEDYSAYTHEVYIRGIENNNHFGYLFKYRAMLSEIRPSSNRIYFVTQPFKTSSSYVPLSTQPDLFCYCGILSPVNSNWTIIDRQLYDIFNDYDDECYKYTKKKLTNDGLTSIKFNSESTSSITLDYDLLSQIGKEYVCVNTVDELSGITNPTDGKLAYVGSYNVTEEKKVVVWDAYGGYSDSINFDYGDGNTYQLTIWSKGREVSLSGTGSFDGGGDYKNSDNETPLGFTFNNGAKGTFVSFEHGDEWSTQEEWKITLWLEKYNGSYPTVTFNTDGATVVETGATVGDVSVHYKEKGFYKFYSDVNKWIATEIYIDNYSNTDIQDVLDDYLDYRKPLTAWFMKDYNGKAYRKGFAGSINPNEETPKITFTTPADDNESGWMLYSIKYQKQNGTWSRTEQRELNIPYDYSINERIASRITTTSSQFGLNIGGLFSVGLDETMSGVTISTTINLDASATDENHIATITDKNSDRGYWEQLCEDGWLNGVTTAATNAEWFVLDYTNFWDGDINSMVTPFAAVKVQDNGDNTFTITYFLSGNNWNSDNWETQYFRFEVDNERGYTWTVTQNQTLTVTPHLYTLVPYTHKNNTNNSLMYKLV